MTAMSPSIVMGRGVLPSRLACNPSLPALCNIRYMHTLMFISSSRIRFSPGFRLGGAKATAMLAAQATTGVEVAIDFYKLLQISHVASRETAVRAYDRCGFSLASV